MSFCAFMSHSKEDLWFSLQGGYESMIDIYGDGLQERDCVDRREGAQPGIGETELCHCWECALSSSVTITSTLYHVQNVRSFLFDQHI